jgi:hypothetical protein
MPLFAHNVRFTHPESAAGEEPSRDTTLAGHLQLVRDTGLTLPPDWRACRERLAALQEAVTGPPILAQRLINAVCDGPPGDLPTKLAAASVKYDSDVIEAVHVNVLARLRELYGPHARKNYVLLVPRSGRSTGAGIGRNALIAGV